MKVFLDANILVSVLNKEYPIFTYSSRILSLADNPKFQLYTSPVCLAIAFYFSEKKSGSAISKRKMEILLDRIDITPMDKTTVTKTIKNKAIGDFEDGLEYYAAHAAKCLCIVTEDPNDFFFSDIEILRAQPFLEKYVIGHANRL